MSLSNDTTYRRKYPRKAFKKAISIMCDGEANIARAVEIGEGGISFSTDSKIAINQKIILNFFLTEKDFFSVRMTLLNVLNSSKQYTYGASFDDVTIALKRQIRAYVARTVLSS